MASFLSWHWVIPLIAVAVAVVTDLRSFRIPNWLTLPLLLSGVTYFTLGYGLPGFTVSAIGVLVGFTMLFPLYLVGAMGAGDIKFMAALGAWLRVTLTLEVLAVSCLLTAIFSVAMVLRRRAQGLPAQPVAAPDAGQSVTPHSMNQRVRVEAVATQSDRRGRLIPFAAMIAGGLAAVWIRDCWV